MSQAAPLILLLLLTFILQSAASSPMEAEEANNQPVKCLKRDDEDDDDRDQNCPPSEDPIDQGNSSTDHLATCDVCQRNFDQFAPIKLDCCGHLFHEHCLRDWTQEHRLLERGCPFCGQKISIDNGRTLAKYLADREEYYSENERQLWGVIASLRSGVVENKPR